MTANPSNISNSSSTSAQDVYIPPEDGSDTHSENVVLELLLALNTLDPVLSEAENNFSNEGEGYSNANTAVGKFDTAVQDAWSTKMKSEGGDSGKIQIDSQEANNDHTKYNQASQQLTTLATSASGENGNLSQALASLASAVSSVESVLGTVLQLLAAGM